MSPLTWWNARTRRAIGAGHVTVETRSPSFFRRHAAKLIASAVITASIIYTLQKGGLKLWPDSGSFAQLRWWTVGGYLATVMAMWYFRAIRWRFLLRPLHTYPRKRILAVSWIGFAAILLMPFRLGEFVRPFMVREKGKVSMPAATGTIVVERVVDGFYLSIVLAVALIFVPHLEPLPATVVGLPVSVAAVRRSGFVMLTFFATVFAVLGTYYFARSWARKITLAVFGLVSRKLGEKLAGIAENVAEGLHFFSHGRAALGFLWETSLYWFFNVTGMWLLAWGCGVAHADGSAPTFGESCALMGMLGVAVLIPGPPGLLGVFQAGLYAGMTMYFPTHMVVGPGAAFVFLLYLIQLVWTVIAALIFLVGHQEAFKQLSHADEATDETSTEQAALS